MREDVILWKSVKSHLCGACAVSHQLANDWREESRRRRRRQTKEADCSQSARGDAILADLISRAVTVPHPPCHRNQRLTNHFLHLSIKHPKSQASRLIASQPQSVSQGRQLAAAFITFPLPPQPHHRRHQQLKRKN